MLLKAIKQEVKHLSLSNDAIDMRIMEVLDRIVRNANNLRRAADEKEERNHQEIMNDISYFGQD